MGEKRTLTDTLARELAKDYTAYQVVLANVLRPFAQMKAKPGSVRAAKFKIHEIVRRLDVLATRWSRAAIAEAYKSKRAEVAPQAKISQPFATPDPEKVIPSKTRIQKLVSTAAENLVKANATIERTAYNFLDAFEKATAGIEAAKTKVETQYMSGDMSAEMSRKVEYYLARGYDEGQISRKLRSYLEQLVGGSDMIEVGGKFFEIKYYAEMVARSELHNAYVEATIDECEKWGADLVQFSRHDSPCAICAQLEGMVFSISGNDEDYPALDDPVEIEVMTKTKSTTIKVDPKFPHPNCEHNLNPVTKNILRAAGEAS